MANDLIRNLELAKTRGRLASSITWKVAIDLAPFLGANAARFFSIGGGAGALQGIAQKINDTIGKNVIDLGGISYMPIGGLQQVKVSQAREVTKRVGLGRESFRPFQIVPQRNETTITAKVVEFYNLQLIGQMFGFPINYLLQQQLALSLLREKRSPDGQVQTLIYSDSWFTKDEFSDDMATANADQLIVHDVTFECGPVFVFDPSGAGSNPEFDLDAVVGLAGSAANALGASKTGTFIDSLADVSIS